MLYHTARYHNVYHTAQYHSVYRACVASSMTPFPMAMPIKLIFTSSGALRIRSKYSMLRSDREEGKRGCDMVYTCYVLEGEKSAGEKNGEYDEEKQVENSEGNQSERHMHVNHGV